MRIRKSRGATMIDPNATGRRLGAYKSAARKSGVTVADWIANYTVLGMAWCYRCREWKGQEVFARDKARPSGYQSICKSCMSHACTASRYRLTRAELSELKSRGCAICESTENIVVDHCHETDRVRDALCQACNSGLGLFWDSPELLRQAAAYLEKHHGRKD